MRRVAVAIVVVSAVAGFATAAASAKLSAPEQAWVDPVIQVYNLEAKALSVVQAEELRVLEDSGAGKYLKTLEGTLAVFASCPVAMKDAGAPPSVRLQSFDRDMVVSCRHLYSGAEDFAHAVGDVRAARGKPAAAALAAAKPQLQAGAKELGVAAHLLDSIGGKNAFEA